jgi:hypothetical protein
LIQIHDALWTDQKLNARTLDKILQQENHHLPGRLWIDPGKGSPSGTGFFDSIVFFIGGEQQYSESYTKN